MYFKGGWSQYAEDHDLHQGFFMIFDYHVSARRSTKLKCTFSRHFFYVISCYPFACSM
jgi:hypothetical protein